VGIFIAVTLLSLSSTVLVYLIIELIRLDTKEVTDINRKDHFRY